MTPSNALFVVHQPQDWPFEVPGANIVAARTYLTDPAYSNGCTHHLVNLCKIQRYQGVGYYVSLLGEARGHQPVPRVRAIRDLQSDMLVRVLTEELDDLVHQCLDSVDTERFRLRVYFGRDPTQRFDALARELFSLMQAPLLEASFERLGGRWRVASLHALNPKDVPAEDRAALASAATAYVATCGRNHRRRAERPYHLAILHNDDDAEPPSNREALAKIAAAAQRAGLRTELITRGDMARLREFDALLIRDTTAVNHYTYRFSRRAVAEGLVAIDDPDSIVRCSNKVYLAELLARHHIPRPRTMTVHRDNVADIVPTLGLPCVLKQPDSAFSMGVVKVATEAELAAKVDEFLEKSELIIAQECLITAYDWRIGVLDRRPLFACQYLMAPGHWQVIKRQEKRKLHEGATIAVPLEQVPPVVVETALAAANLIGDGLYGVDLKLVGGRCYVIEVNDNPNIDAGNEDAQLGDSLYDELVRVFVRRIEAAKEAQAAVAVR